MRLSVLSDLHLEFAPYAPAGTGADVIILAGDIHIGVKGIQWAREIFGDTPVIYVAGNHEYYRQSYPDHLDKMRAAAEGTNVRFLENESMEIGGVTTKRLNEQVKRNGPRFPADFMFRLTLSERTELVAKCDRFDKLKHSSVMPYAFTEHGAVMLASMLNSTVAVHASIQVVRAFVRMRYVLAYDKDLARRMEKLEKKVDLHDTDIRLILQDMRKLLSVPEPDTIAKDVPRVRGFAKE